MSTTTPAPLRNLPPFPSPEHKHALDFGEIARFAYDTFCSNKIRFALTALGMVIGNASLILVVTIGMTGKQYILNQIQAIGANMVYITQEGTGEPGGKHYRATGPAEPERHARDPRAGARHSRIVAYGGVT